MSKKRRTVRCPHCGLYTAQMQLFDYESKGIVIKHCFEYSCECGGDNWIPSEESDRISLAIHEEKLKLKGHGE